MDALSKLFAVIILIGALILVPLYQFLEKQDALVYQEVRQEVTSFVDNVRHKGYITPSMYTDLQNALSIGSQVYEVKLKHTEPIFVPVYSDPANPNTFSSQWEQHENEYVNAQILKVLFPDNQKDINDKSRIYYLQAGDSFDIEIDRLSDSTAERLRSMLIGNAESSKLWYGISYGGIVLNENY